MSDTTNEKVQFADYSGYPVIVEEIFNDDCGPAARITFDDGREDVVPLRAINLVD